MKSLIRCLAVVLGVLALAGIPGMPATAYGQQPQTPTFTSKSELVLVPVIVRDKSGKHVSGLKASDFLLQEDGKNRQSALFEEVRTVGRIEAGRTPADNVYTNFLSADAQPRRLLIIAFDLINTPFLQQARARQELINFLSTAIKGDEPVALVTLTSSGVKQIHSFTTDPRVLVAALRRVSGRTSSMESTQLVADQTNETAFLPKDQKELTDEEKALNDFKTANAGTFARYQQKENIRQTLRSLEEIANAYAGLPGRKSLLWATSGFPFMMDDPSTLGGYDTSTVSWYQRVWRAMNQANMSIYPVDLKGVLNYAYDARFDASMRGPGRNLSLASASYQLMQDSMRSFANATGGTACLDRNDLMNCFKLAAEDSESYYLLGYYLGTEQRKPGWHKLKVTVSEGGYQVRARNGFYVGEQRELQKADLVTELGTALAAELDYTGIHFDLIWGEVSDAQSKPGVKHAAFDLSVLPAAINIDAANQNHMSVEFAALVNENHGKHVAEFSKNVTADLKPESADQVRKFGLRYRDRLEVPPGNYLVKFVIRDNSTGKMGTVSAPLQVR